MTIGTAELNSISLSLNRERGGLPAAIFVKLILFKNEIKSMYLHVIKKK